ncbi:glycoside hydrolase family 3 protein [Brevibacillus ginsengisoli]|uniref:glycoside hydrolase family 3 protein n=1 Tax=Brevibacillus ginsengisoli TaxID=363854 RepID=UPI003CF42B03
MNDTQLIHYKSNPFYLSDEDIDWVEQTVAGMKLEEKVGQLFCLEGETNKEEDLRLILEEFQPGGVMYRPGPAAQYQKNHRFLQKHSTIPLLIAANLEAGGNGISQEGTYFGKQMQIAATDDEDMAYKLGLVAGREGRAVGCNWAFAPVIDIDVNYHNPITNTRTFGSDPDRVLRMAKAYMKGIHEAGLAVSIKHWPGDGIDARDQHLHPTINSLSCEEWDETFGKVYKGMIEAGAQTLMAAHILLPAYSRKFNPGLKNEELLPASLAPELMMNLLRNQLGFNGMVVTDASIMGGMMMAGKRKDTVPGAIAAGCDMFLFVKNLKEDYEYMMRGVEKGIISLHRLDEAVRRILATKASLKLHQQKEEGKLVPPESALSVLKCEEHQAWAKECADKSITLVKDKQNLLPLSPEKQKNILLFVKGDNSEGVIGHKEPVSQKFIAALEKEGFNVTLFHNKKNIDEINEYWMEPIEELKQKYDVAIYFSNLETYSNQTVVRVEWENPFGYDMPWFTGEIPTMFISVANPYHLQDVPRIPTFINGYSSGNEYVIEAIVEKLLGKSEFKGISPVDPYCGYWDAKL